MNRQTYWTYQFAGWSVFAAIGLVINVINGGYLPSLIVGHVLLVFYGIGLTHLFRPLILGRQTRLTGRVRKGLVRSGCILVIGALLTLLVIATDHVISGSHAYSWPWGAVAGMFWLDQLSDVPQVIFTAAFDEYAIKAFEVNALDYLLKPIAPERLAAALQRAVPREAPKRLSQVFVRDGDRCWIVRIPEIFLLESEGNYTRLHFSHERPLIRRSLNVLEEQLDPALFFRASRRQIINLTWIEKIDLNVQGGFTVTLRGGPTVEMSRRQADRLRDILSL